MKKQYKILGLVLTVVMMGMLVLTACQSSQPAPTSKSAPSSAPAPASSSSPAPAPAAKYPEKPIQVVIPTGTGGDTDLNARIFSKYLEKELGVPVVCTNVTGAGGAVGARQVKDAAKDGYTTLFFQYAGLIQEMTGVVDFSYTNDFQIAGIGMFDKCNIWLGKKGGKYNSMKDVIEDAKKNPGKINIGISGTGNMAHYIAKLTEQQGGVQFNLVDLGGQSQLQAALMSGQIAAFTAYYSNSKSFIESGNFNVLGVFSEGKHKLLPDAPTMTEQGFNTNFLNDKYYYYAFPKGTPKEFVNKFAAAMEKVTKNPEAQKEFDKYYVTLEYKNPEESVKYINGLNEQYKKYSSVFTKK